MFRTKSAAQTDLKTLQELGSFTFVCVKRYDKVEGDETYDDSYISRMAEHDATTFGELVKKRRDKVLIKEKRLAEKKKSRKSRNTNHSLEAICENTRVDDSYSLDDNYSMKDNNIKKDSPQEQDAGSEVDESKEDNDLSLRIPEVASVLCDNDDETYRELPDSIRNNTSERLFIPGTHHDLVSKDDVLEFTDTFRDDVQNSVNGVCRFNDDKECDSETESDDSAIENNTAGSCHTANDDFMSEMLKIEKTLPALRDSSLLKLKGGQDLKAEDGSGKKKANKSKPGVKKALKDLMKTTEGKKDKLPSETDERFIEASSKIRQRPQLILGKADGLKSNVKPNAASNDEKVQSDDTSSYNHPCKIVKDGIVISSKSVKPQESENKSSGFERQVGEEAQKQTKNDTDQAMCFEPDENIEKENTIVTNMIEMCEKKEEDKSLSCERTTDIHMSNTMTSLNDPSTDGDDVEMIYQANDLPGIHPVNNDTAPLVLQADNDFDVIERVNTVNELANKNGDVTTFSKDDIVSTKTDDEKIKRVFKPSKQAASPKRNRMFQKSNKSSLRRNFGVGADSEIPRQVASKSLDVDMEVTDFDQDGVETKQDVIKYMDTGLHVKLNTGKGTKRKPKRAIERYNSDRKYLGSSVPSRQAKKKQ